MKRLFLLALAALLLPHPSPAAPGSLDTAFGSGGKITLAIGSDSDYASSVVTLANNKFLVAGYYSNGGQWDFALLRYNANGTLDTSFGTGGKVLTAIGTSHDVAHSIAMQTDGKIVVAGDSHNGTNYDFAVVRYQANGSLDTTFNGTGKVTTPIGGDDDNAVSVAVQSNGAIVVAGYSSNGTDQDYAVVRYTAGGSLDTTFQGTGIVTTAIGNGEDTLLGMVLQPNGKIIAAGNADVGSDVRFAVVRYNTDGSLDTTFGGTGRVTTVIGSDRQAGAYGVALQPNGKIVLAGAASNGSDYDFALARYNANGSLDTTFGAAGKVITPIGSSFDVVYGVAVQPDGRIVATGFYSKTSTDFDVALARYNPNGGLDTTFGTSGKALTAFGIGRDEMRNVIFQPNGKLLTAGFATSNGNIELALARYDAGSLVAAPSIAVEQPPGEVLTSSASTVNFGSLAPGTGSPLTFTITNSGQASLSLSAAVTGSNAGDFHSGTLSGPVAAGGSAALTVTFTPSAEGPRSATLRLTSNDPLTPAFDIFLTGSGAVRTELEKWRLQWFGTLISTGDAADSATPQNDGVTNFLKFATGIDPSRPGRMPGVIARNGSNLEFTYARAKAALTDGFVFRVEWSPSLTAPVWGTAGVTETILSQDSTTQQVKATVSLGADGKRFLRLRITKL